MARRVNLGPLGAAVVLLGCGQGPELAQRASALTTAVFQDGVSPTAAYAGTADLEIDEDTPTLNEGSVDPLTVTGGTGGPSIDGAVLLRWDLSSVPAGATVTAAWVTLEITNQSNQTYGAYEVLRPWGELQASWNDASIGQPWQTPGAQGALDRASTVVGTIPVSSQGPFTFNLDLAMVQRWIDAPSANHGIIFASTTNNNDLIFNSRETATAASRPRLSIDYSDPTDGGTDGGTDAGIDAGTGGGSDAGLDAGDGGASGGAPPSGVELSVGGDCSAARGARWPCLTGLLVFALGRRRVRTRGGAC